MRIGAPNLRHCAIAAGYFAVAALTIAMTRFENGIAFIWVATAYLVPVLARRSLRAWPPLLLLCGGANVVATGLFGLGWTLAIPFALINMGEAALIAWLLRRPIRRAAVLASIRAFGIFCLVAGIFAPVIAAALAAGVIAFTGRPPLPVFLQFATGHALGNLSYIPIVVLVMSGEFGRILANMSRARRVEFVGLMLLVALATVATFAQQVLPILFLPFGPIMLALFRFRKIGASLAIVLLSIIGGGLTMTGHGPIQLIEASVGGRMQFFQFYLACVVFTVLPVLADLRNRAALHRDLRFSEERFRMLTEQMSDIVMHLETSGRIRYVSPSIRDISGFEPEQLVGLNSRALIVPEDLPHVRDWHERTIAAGGEATSYEYRGLLADGQQRWFETRSRAIFDRHGSPEGVISVIQDISRRKAMEQRLTQAAMTDPLTGLANRRAFKAAADQFVDDGRSAWVVVLDLDHFKHVNDTFGHDGGDAVLRHFARLARAVLRKDDVVARLGGEEFALILVGPEHERAIGIVERLRTDLAASRIAFQGKIIRVTVSAGLTPLGKGGIDAALRQADLALYEAKAAGRDRLAMAA